MRALRGVKARARRRIDEAAGADCAWCESCGERERPQEADGSNCGAPLGRYRITAITVFEPLQQCPAENRPAKAGVKVKQSELSGSVDGVWRCTLTKADREVEQLQLAHPGRRPQVMQLQGIVTGLCCVFCVLCLRVRVGVGAHDNSRVWGGGSHNTGGRGRIRQALHPATTHLKHEAAHARQRRERKELRQHRRREVVQREGLRVIGSVCLISAGTQLGLID